MLVCSSAASQAWNMMKEWLHDHVHKMNWHIQSNWRRARAGKTPLSVCVCGCR